MRRGDTRNCGVSEQHSPHVWPAPAGFPLLCPGHETWTGEEYEQASRGGAALLAEYRQRRPTAPKSKPPSGKPLYVPSLGLIYAVRRLWSRVSRSIHFGGRADD